MKSIETVLTEANLTAEQVSQFVELVEEAKATERANLRAAHIKEIREIENDRDATIGTLMRDLVEAKAAVPATDTPPAKAKLAEEEKDCLEAEIMARADKMVEEALAAHAPILRQARAYSKLKAMVESIGKIICMPVVTAGEVIAESRLENENSALRDRIYKLESEALVYEQTALFESSTAGMADTTREKVKSLMEASRPRSLEDYADMLAVAVNTVKPARKENEHLNESKNVKPAPVAPALTGPALYAKLL
jgi:hypothetical protein